MLKKWIIDLKLKPFYFTQLSYIDRIKLLMMVAMTVGHWAWAFVPIQTMLSQCLHFVARITIPLACFLLVIGYQKTHNLTAYVKRLFGFAVLAQIPFIFSQIPLAELWENPHYLWYGGNVLFSLGVALLALICAEKLKTVSPLEQKFCYGLALVMLFVLSLWSDWSYAVMLWVLAIFYYGVRGFITTCLLLLGLSAVVGWSYHHRLVPLVASSLMDYGVFLAIPIMHWYHINKHRSPTKFRLPRLTFYWYYPLHLLVIGYFAFGF